MKIKENWRFATGDLLRMYHLLWQADRKSALLSLVLQALQAFLPAASLYVIKLLIEQFNHKQQGFAPIVALLLVFGALQVLLAVIGQFAAYIGTIHQQTLTDYLAQRVLKQATEVDYAYYENPTYHDTLHLAQQQSLYRATLLLINFNSVVLNGLSLVFLAGLFFSMQTLLALLFVALSLPLAIIKWISGYALLRMERQTAALERESYYLHSTLTGVNHAKEVRIFGFAQSFITKFKNIRQQIHELKKGVHARLMWYNLAAEAAEVIATTLIFALLAHYTWQGALSIGTFVIYLQGLQRLQSSSKGFLQSLVQIIQQRIFLRDLFAFFNIGTAQLSGGTQSFDAHGEGLHINKVSFTYPQTSKLVLKDVNIRCQPGQIIAIVGENGSGKSTLVKLLSRLYALQQGSISIHQQDIAHISMDDYRQQSVFLFQDFEKYFFTVAENVALGQFNNQIDYDAVAQAAALSGADAFVSKLSQGYKTRMGRLFDGSEQLSGGQWQKLALARIFYKQAQLIVLDEPTSAIDATAEMELFNNVKKHLGHKMVILITHRLYNLKIADYVYVMHDGQIAQEGTFAQLAQQPGLFKTMYQAQQL